MNECHLEKGDDSKMWLLTVGDDSMQKWLWTFLLLLLVVAGLAMTMCTAAGPRITIVVGSAAPELEQRAARELARMLEKLFEVQTQIEVGAEQTVGPVILVGRPQSNSILAAATGSDWPVLSSQGLILKKIAGINPILIVGGGSPVAVMWATYDLMERMGVRYLLDRDVYPPKRSWSGLPNLDLVSEPNMRVRCWRLVNDLALGPVSWSLEENRRFLRQIAKMKYNRIQCSLWPAHPFVHYSFRGMEKPPGFLYFGQRHPIGPDTIGREKFGGMSIFTNPELMGADSPEEMRRRAIGLVRGILEEARNLGMETGLAIQPFEWPREFTKVLPGSEPVHQLGDLTAGPGRDQSMEDPLLQEMVATIVRAYVQTYPDIDFLHVGMPEHRSWVGEAEGAYRKLAKRYGLQNIGSYAELCERARSRTSFAGGGERVETMLKGDLSSLSFFDALLKEKRLLERPGGGEKIKMVYNGVVAELFPLVARMLPKGGEMLSFIAYTASRQLQQRGLLKQVPPAQVPVSLIFTLADDNVGVLPQLATGSLHTLMGELQENRWAGFYTRYWTAGDLDPTTHYLAKASWDSSVTPEGAYADQVRHVCGPDAVEPALKAFAIIEQITVGLDQHGLGFGFPVPKMMTKHYDKGGLSEPIKQDRQLYDKALRQMEEAHRHSRLEGQAYTNYFVGRLRFAVRYLDAAEAYGATAVALEAGQKDEARRQIELAYEAIRESIAAYASVTKDHGDLGAIALMNEYCYRPIRDKRNELGS